METTYETDLEKNLRNIPLWVILLIVANEIRNRSAAVAQNAEQAQALRQLAGQMDVAAHSIRHKPVTE